MKNCNIFIKKLKTGIFALVSITCIIACADAQKKDFKTSGKFSLLWEITGEGMQKPSYLYGTIHIYDSNVFRIPEEVYTAIDNCENFATEVDLNNIDQGMLLQRIMINDPDSALNRLLKPEVYNEIQTIPIIRMMGESVNMIKPFFIQQYILIENPLELQSVDLNLNSHAKNRDRNIQGIETFEEQFDAIDAVSLSEQAQGITDIYDYCKRENTGFAEAGKKLFSTIQEAYKNQDFEKLVNLEDEFKMTSSSSVSDLAMIGLRNGNMADRIDGFIKQGKTLFVAVGALHLPDYKGLRGVVTLLKEKGYSLRPVLIDLEVK